MNKYTADEVLHEAELLEDMACGHVSDILREFARRLRQEGAENRRDPVLDPRPGDRMIMPCGWQWVFVPCEGKYAQCSEHGWREEIERFPGATIIRRRETPK